MSRRATMAVSILLLGTAQAGPALASSCEQLRFGLANLRDDIGARGQARKYARAIAEQKSSLRQLDFTMRQEGCSAGSVVVVGEANQADCSQFEDKRTRMQRNLEILKHKQLSLLSDDSVDVERQQLTSALDEQGCNAEPLLVTTPEASAVDEPLVREETYASETVRVPDDASEYDDSQFVDLGGVATNGSFRTMCVRTCDGAYFPVSSYASTLDFRRDAQVCSMMCPGTETELYYHSVQQESAMMRSAITGRGYDELPNAFRFRTEKPEDKRQCGCNFPLYYREMMKREAHVAGSAEPTANQSSIVWVKPALKIEKAAAETRSYPVERDYVPSDKIRVIGPRFLPDDDGLDFKHPTGSIGAIGR